LIADKNLNEDMLADHHIHVLC